MSELSKVASRHKLERRRRLLELFPDEICVGDRVVISAGPKQDVLAEIVAVSKDVRYDLQACDWVEQPVFLLETTDGEPVEKWHTKSEMSYCPAPEDIWAKAKAIRNLNNEEKRKARY